MLYPIKYVAKQLDSKASLKKLSAQVSNRSSQRVKTAIRKYCCVEKFEQKHVEWLYNFSCDIACTKNNPVDIINAMLEFLVKSSVEFLAFSTLERMANKARTSILNDVFSLIRKSLSTQAIATLNKLLTVNNNQGYTTDWHNVKREPEKPTVTTLRQFLKHTQWLQALKLAVGPLQALPEQRRYQLLAEAQAYSADKMKELKPAKRYALMVIMIHEKTYVANDCIADMLIKKVRSLHTSAKKALEIFQKKIAPESAELITSTRDRPSSSIVC